MRKFGAGYGVQVETVESLFGVRYRHLQGLRAEAYLGRKSKANLGLWTLDETLDLDLGLWTDHLPE